MRTDGVMRHDGPNETFGCERCWPADADAAWNARAALTRGAELIDESHFRVTILACPCCRQNFISVFTEMVDWEHGDDPQHWALLPITSAEAAGLAHRGASLTGADLRVLGRGRRCLRRDHPKSAAPSSAWSTGLTVGPYD